MNQILPFFKGIAIVLCFVAIGISAVCAFVEGNVLTIIAGVITMALDVFATIKAFQWLDEQDKKK